MGQRAEVGLFTLQDHRRLALNERGEVPGASMKGLQKNRVNERSL